MTHNVWKRDLETGITFNGEDSNLNILNELPFMEKVFNQKVLSNRA